jgi:hypothetical protein
MARECRHPDAQWLASLFPHGNNVYPECFHRVMQQQGDDPRAMHLGWFFGPRDSDEAIERAAALGYARAQVLLSVRCDDRARSFELAQRAAAGGDRSGLFRLAVCFSKGQGCAVNTQRAIELYKRAAELGDGNAQFWFGEKAFGEFDWERYHWWGLAAARGWDDMFRDNLLPFVSSFEDGENGRILHTVAPVVRANLDVAAQSFFGTECSEETIEELEVLLEVHNGMLNSARAAIACWGVVGARLGLVEDMRFAISRMLWEEAWRWNDS